MMLEFVDILFSTSGHNGCSFLAETCKQGSVVSICTNMDCCRVSGRSDYEVSLVYVQQTVTLYGEFPDYTGM